MAIIVAVLSMLLDRRLRSAIEPVHVEAVPASAPIGPEPPPTRRHSAPEPVAAVPEPPPEPVAAPPAAEPSHDVTGQVTDRAGHPLLGADVELLDAKELPVVRGKTDADGAFKLRDARDAATTLAARAAGHMPGVVPLSRDAAGAVPSPVAVRLEPAAAIVGRVRTNDGKPPAAKIHVMVSGPLDSSPARWTLVDCAKATARDDLRVPTSVTDDSGAFRIDGLAPGGWYTLMAAGPAMAESESTAVEAQAGGAPAEIVVAPLYVMDVRIRGPQGEPLRLAPIVHLAHGMGCVGPLATKPTYIPACPQAQWAGLTWSDGNSEESPDPRWLVAAYAADVRSDRLGPFEVSARIPGYRPVTAEVWALKMEPGGKRPVQEIRLGPAETEFGSIRLRLEDKGTGLAAAFAESAKTRWPLRMPALLLTPDPSRAGDAAVNDMLTVPLHHAASGPVEVAGVPVGHYSACFEIPLGTQSMEESRFDVYVKPNEVSEIVYQAPEWGAIRLDLKVGEAASALYRGTFELLVRRAGAKRDHKIVFSQWPYLVVGIKPGTYDVAVSNPRLTVQPFTVEVQPNKVTSVTRDAVPNRDSLRGK